MNRFLVLFFLLLIGIFCGVYATLAFREGRYKHGILLLAVFTVSCLWVREKTGRG